MGEIGGVSYLWLAFVLNTEIFLRDKFKQSIVVLSVEGNMILSIFPS